MSIRNCVTRLSAAQRNAYVRGVKALMTSGRYQWYVTTHSDAQSMNFHETPWFLPWHRQFLRIYEADLRTALGDPSFALPYWDSVGDWANAMSTSFTPLSDAQASIVANAASVWCDDLMGHSHGGPDGDDVTSGPFANTATTTPAGLLRRGYGMPPTASSTALPTRAALGQVLTETASGRVSASAAS